MSQPTSWEVRLAAVLTGLGVVPGIALLAVASKLIKDDPGFLFAIMPVIVAAVVGVGLWLTFGAVLVTVSLFQGRRGVRLHVAGLGVALAFAGIFGLTLNPGIGLLLAGYGGLLVWLMFTPAAARDLGAWRRQIYTPPAPWGSTPGRGPWSPEPQQQGPWLPPPSTVPFMPWVKQSGPRTPWWQIWQAGLAQGIPLWELIVLVGAMLTFLVGLVGGVPALFEDTFFFKGVRIGDGGRFSPLLLLVPGSIAVVYWLEKRMRARLERG